MSLFTDTHCHLDFYNYDEDRESVIQRAMEAGVVWMLNPGIDIPTSKAAIQLSHSYPDRIKAAVGIHPNYGKPWSDNLLSQLKRLAQSPEVVAIGEIGLDYYRKHTPIDQQHLMFQAQLELAAELSLPIIIHLRDAVQDLMTTLTTWHQKLVRDGHPLAEKPGVLHSYSADYDTAMEAISMNFLIGVSGPVTFRNAADRKSVTRRLPLKHLLLETDAPFLAPHPYRGRRNEPAYIPLIASKIAALHHTSTSQVAQITYANAQRLFNITEIKK